MLAVRTSAGRSLVRARSMAMVRSTASGESPCPVRRTATISSSARSASAMSPGSPVMVISLPRTSTSTSGYDCSTTRSNSSPEPSRLTIGTLEGTTILCWAPWGAPCVSAMVGLTACSRLLSVSTAGPAPCYPRSGSARWPSHVASAQHVTMDVKDRLAGLGTGVEDQSERLQPFGYGAGFLDHLDEGLPVRSRQRRHVRMMGARNDQHVGGRLRGDVTEGDRPLRLTNDGGGHLARDDAAEQAVDRRVHAPHRTDPFDGLTVDA